MTFITFLHPVTFRLTTLLAVSPASLDVRRQLSKSHLSALSTIRIEPSENPTLSSADRVKALSGLVPSSSSPILLNLLTVLSENGRLGSAEKVFADFNSLIAAYRGELEVIVTSAEPLDSKSLSRVEKALKSTQAANGKTLRITNRVSSRNRAV